MAKQLSPYMIPDQQLIKSLYGANPVKCFSTLRQNKEQLSMEYSFVIMPEDTRLARLAFRLALA
jgi:hypothetical protein